MFFEISKLLHLFISPISWILLLLIIAFFLKKKKQKRTCFTLCFIIFLIFTDHPLFSYIKHLTVRNYSTAKIDTTKQYKLAIVMGGFGSMNKETHQMRYEQDKADRLWEAVRLYKTGRVKRILITGDPTSTIQSDGSSTVELFLLYMKQIGIPRTTFILEQKARNTKENASYTSKILREENISDKDCILITSVSHIKRSLLCFAKVGLHPDYFPVNIYDKPQKFNHRDFYPKWSATVDWEDLLNEWIGDSAYRIMGYI